MIFVFLFLTYFTLYNRFQVHQICVFSWLIFHCIYVPQFLYPFICQWASKFLSCPGDCKQCCGEHWGTCIILIYGLLRIYAQQWKCWVIWQFYSQFSFFFFLKEFIMLFFRMFVSTYVLTNSAGGFPFLNILPSNYSLQAFLMMTILTSS